MTIWAKGLIALVALLHVGFLVMEMFLWQTPLIMQTFGITEGFAQRSSALAANMGLYNGFLAAGLIWSLVAPPYLGRPVALFFLGCVVVAGVFGAFTVKLSILFIQALPAALALAAVILVRLSAAALWTQAGRSMRNLQGERSGPYPVFTRIAGDAQEMSMKRLVLLAAAAALVVTATPALAKSKKKHRVHHGYYAEQYAPYPGWASRNVSDPSLGYNYGLNRARSTGRCVADLGYGRYEYCGW